MQSWGDLIDLINLILSWLIKLAGKMRGYLGTNVAVSHAAGSEQAYVALKSCNHLYPLKSPVFLHKATSRYIISVFFFTVIPLE